MKYKLNKELLLKILGILFLSVAIIRFLVLLLIVKNLTYVAWFSNHVMFLLSIGVLMRKRILVTAELCIALIPETLWSLDFLSKLIFNKYLFGVTEYMFKDGLAIGWQNISSLQHLFIVPLGLLAVWLMRADKNGWKVSLLHASIIWIVGFIIGPKYNLNCIFEACIPQLERIWNYTLTWPIIVFCLILISSFFIKRIIKFNNHKNVGF